LVIEWGAVTWKLGPLAVRQAKRWWNRDPAKNLSRGVEAELEGDERLGEGAREQLVAQWLAVRNDCWLATISSIC
jgi:hypothetical protein